MRGGLDGFMSRSLGRELIAVKGLWANCGEFDFLG